MEDRTISLSIATLSVPKNKCGRHVKGSWLPVIQSPWLLAQLAVIPVQEKKGKRAHNQEKQDPHAEACVVFDCLEKKEETTVFKEM